ncbi:MAG TPA: hypothetical protein VEY50_07830 [Lysobacter sp.]|nr:hypothetical protein [Lysobacter sp.]
MTLRALRPVLLLLALALLVACASGPGGRLQTAGAVKVYDMTLDTSLDWARIRLRRSEVWTIDGTPLNRLAIFSGVRPGEHVFLLGRERRSRPDGPWYRAGMRLDELQALVVDGLRDQHWVGIQTDNLRPHRFGNVDGLRFDLELTNPSGLIYRGTAAVAERNGRLTVLLWMAPREHYHGRDVAAVDAMLDSMRFTAR